MRPSLILATAAVLYLLRFDVWLWNSPRLVFGLPAGLAYHLAYCLVVAIVLGWTVRRRRRPLRDAGRDYDT